MVSEEVTRFTIDDLGELMQLAFEELPPRVSCRNVKDVIDDEGDFIYIGHDAVVELAAEINRHGNWNPVDALEMAFDSLLAAGNGRQFERVGEVILLPDEMVANAYCKRKE